MRVPSPRSRNPLIVAARFVWTLPTNVLGHLVALIGTRSRPRHIGSEAAAAWLYLLPRQSRWRFIGAVALGDVVISAPEAVEGERGRLVLAHELSHVRQHHVLGPFYLPLHALAQLVSACLYLVRPKAGSTPQHAYNPLEQRFLCVPFAALARERSPLSEPTVALLTTFGV